MNNVQFFLSIGLPILFILAGMFFNWSASNGLRSEIKDVRGEISSLRTDVRGEISSLRTELRGEISSLRTELRGEINGVRSEVHGLRGEMYKKLDSFEAKLDDLKDSNRKDALEIMRQMTALHERVAIVESKQG